MIRQPIRMNHQGAFKGSMKASSRARLTLLQLEVKSREGAIFSQI